MFTPALPEVRCQIDGVVRVRGLQFQALALFLRGPRSFTGEDTVELHVLGSPLLVELLIEALCSGGKQLGVRVALPGEFTARAVQNGKLDGLGVEGLLVLLHAADHGSRCRSPARQTGRARRPAKRRSAARGA